LDHKSGEAHAFYRSLQGTVRVGIEATGPIHWFERLLGELGHELWIGIPAGGRGLGPLEGVRILCGFGFCKGCAPRLSIFFLTCTIVFW
jgi:hypothetical protein